MWIDVLGWVASVFVIVMFLPQLVKMLKLKSSGGVSANTWLLNIAFGTGWFIFGIREDIIQQIVLNIIFVLLVFVLLYVTYKEAHKPMYYFFLAILGAIVLAVIYFVLPMSILSIVIVCLVVSSDIPQLVRSIKSFVHKTPTAVSTATWLIGALGTILWLSFGLLNHTPAIIWANIISLLTKTTIFSVESINSKRFVENDD